MDLSFACARPGAGTEWQMVDGRQHHYERGVICSREGTQNLSVEQVKDLNFPVGCPVSYNFFESHALVWMFMRAYYYLLTLTSIQRLGSSK